MHDLVIEAGQTERRYWRDLWRYRELFYFLAWRDILVRYKQTVIGVAWSVIRPVLQIAILTVVFGRVANLSSGGVPYPILVLCGVLPWQFFATSLTESGNSLVTNTGMISKIYFPRMILPASKMIASLTDFAISACLLVILMLWYRFTPSPTILLLPLFLALAVAASLGAGLWISALMVPYRDFRYIVPFIVQFGVYVSPVGFSSEVVTRKMPEAWRFLYWLNPMAGVIDGFRWAILGGKNVLYLPGLLLSIGTAFLMIVFGIRYFRRTERTFADVI